MRYRFIICSLLTVGLALVPLAATAQTDQTTTAPMATATLNPGATVNPMATASPMGVATATPGTTIYQNGSGGGNSTGWWGLIGLIGLLGLFGGRRNRTIT
jgi:MYXO-CTERM domain-containing protein